MKWRIPVAEPSLGDEEKKAVIDVLESGRISQGERVAEFEQKIAKYLGRKYAIACHSGTCANEVMVMALWKPNVHDLLYGGPGSAAMPVCTSVAVSNPLVLAHVAPKFVDLDSSLGMDAAKIPYDDVGFALAVDAYGSPASGLETIDQSIPLLEDACVALGSEYHARKLGSFGCMSALSFYVNKTITCGEGGMVVTDDEDFATYAREYVNHGRKHSTYHEEWYYNHFGRNAKMTDLQAAIGLAQLDKLSHFLEARRTIGQALSYAVGDNFQHLIMSEGVSPWAFWVADFKGNVDMRKASQRLQTECGIETRPTLPILPKLPFYECKEEYPIGTASQNGFLVSCSPALLDHGDLPYLEDSLREVLSLV